MTKTKYWDFTIYVKSFSAKTVLDSLSFKMITDGDYITYRRGIFNKSFIDMNDIKNYTFYDINYMEVIPQTPEDEITNMVEWLSRNSNIHYSILFTGTKNKNLITNIRFYSIKDAFDFRLYFDGYIKFNQTTENKKITMDRQ